MREIGPEYMLRSYKSLYSLNSETSQAANDLVMGMHEIQRRDRNWEETLYGEMLKARPGGTCGDLDQSTGEVFGKAGGVVGYVLCEGRGLGTVYEVY